MMMLAFALFTAVAAFAPSSVPASRGMRLLAVTPAYEAAVAVAESASSKFGAKSAEAVLAWEIVTDLDEANMNARRTMGSLDEECDTTDKACVEFESKMGELKELMGSVEGMAEMPGVDSSYSTDALPKAAARAPESSAAKAAEAIAMEASKTFGYASPEAKAAWENYEELNYNKSG